MYSAILTALTFILFGINLAGFVAVDTLLLGVMFIITGIVVLVEGTGVYKRFN